MINLIPIEKKKSNQKDFYFRFLSVCFMMFTFLILILIIAISPAYFISLEKKNSANLALENQKKEILLEVDEKALITTQNLETRLDLLEKARKDKYVFSEKVIDKIISKKIPGIKIDRIFYENDSLKGRKIILNGMATSREQLLSFRRGFENDPSFKNVDLPISNFVKGRDIEFTLNLISI